ncbi:uncharacterized protein LOC132613716 [Lycium barbarum]|uniref:uncharacterized protein LOC132613716 n=1 Tax=Lycium barbarum TaxID=112863 RepID=UPI00293E090B|nr:uncharacterized protein LOC132613716 [Lycium barbarum]
MEYRLNITEITPETREWTCKVQLIEKARARQSKDGRIRFQVMIAQDETEEQVAVVLYGDDIGKYEKKFTPFNTYLISTAKVRPPLPYGIPINKFEWVLDRFTVIEQVKGDNVEDPPLPTPTRLNTVSLSNLDQEPRQGVLHCYGNDDCKCADSKKGVSIITVPEENRPHMISENENEDDENVTLVSDSSSLCADDFISFDVASDIDDQNLVDAQQLAAIFCSGLYTPWGIYICVWKETGNERCACNCS